MQEHIEVMKKALSKIFCEKVVALYLYGSAVLGDYKPGWSDIDILCLTAGKLTEQEKIDCLMLRQTLVDGTKNSVYRTFEGAIVPLDDFVSDTYSELVYWGTSGQRIAANFCFDVFSMYELINHGQLIAGTDIRSRLSCPTYDQLREGVIAQYQTIRQYVQQTDERLYSCGWLLVISRCIYTLRTGRIIAKTRAGEWALEQNLCPDRDSLEKTLLIRNNPLNFKDLPETKRWLCSLAPQVQAYASVLEAENERTKLAPKMQFNYNQSF